MNYQKTILAGMLLVITGLFACDSTEIGDSKDVNQDKIYMDYNLSYTEADENVQLKIKFRFSGSAGTTLVLNNTSQVELDGEILKVDSTEFGGAFYEVSKNFNRFAGKHTITFTDINGKKFENSFDFAPFALVNLPTAADRDKDLVISYNTPVLNANDYVAISSLDTDSSFYYNQAGPASSVTIPATQLKRQKDKMVSFETTIYREIPLTQTTTEGGVLKQTYRLKPVKIKLQP
jgi:hypothetical protein